MPTTRAATKLTTELLSTASSNQSDQSWTSMDEPLSDVTQIAEPSKKRKRTVQPKAVKTEQVEAGDELLPHGLGKLRLRHVLDSGSDETISQLPSVQPKEEPTKPSKKPKLEFPKEREGIHEAPKKTKAKAHPYGLTPGVSPFPDHTKPTPADCEEVHALLTKEHGLFTPPDAIPPPSATVAGCGEVPDLLDAVLRTLLSQNTTNENAAKALKSLIERFGEDGGSPKWDVVRQSHLAEIVKALTPGGLQDIKGKNMKKILDTVYNRNLERHEALLTEIKDGKKADIAGAKTETKEQKSLEIQKNLLSLDYLFNLTSDEVMDELIQLPGIGVKTASCVILFCMKRPSFAVDTHVHRHVQWLGWVPLGTNADKSFSHLEVRIPDHLKYGLHQLFIKHGKKCGRCTARTSEGSVGWDEVICPIEHLVKRTGRRKNMGPKILASKRQVESKSDKTSGESVAKNETAVEAEKEVKHQSDLEDKKESSVERDIKPLRINVNNKRMAKGRRAVTRRFTKAP